MIVKTLYGVRDDGVRLFETKSDAGFKLRQNETGIVYDSAIDVENAPFTYAETDEPIEQYTEEQLSTMSNAELQAVMADMGIGGTMNKANMVALIMSHQQEV